MIDFGAHIMPYEKLDIPIQMLCEMMCHKLPNNCQWCEMIFVQGIFQSSGRTFHLTVIHESKCKGIR